MGDITQAEHAIEAAADAVAQDVVAYVKAHPNYTELVRQLGEKAIAALAAGL